MKNQGDIVRYEGVDVSRAAIAMADRELWVATKSTLTAVSRRNTASADVAACFIHERKSLKEDQGKSGILGVETHRIGTACYLSRQAQHSGGTH